MRPPISQYLERNPDDKVFFGVSSGLGAYFGIDPVLVRVGFVVTAFLTGGAMLVIYIALAVLMPVKSPGRHDDSSDQPAVRMSDAAPGDQSARWRQAETRERHDSLWRRRRRIGGFVIILVGALILASNLGAFEWVTFGIFVSAVLIGAGLFVLAGAFSGGRR